MALINISSLTNIECSVLGLGHTVNGQNKVPVLITFYYLIHPIWTLIYITGQNLSDLIQKNSSTNKIAYFSVEHQNQLWEGIYISIYSSLVNKSGCKKVIFPDRGFVRSKGLQLLFQPNFMPQWCTSDDLDSSNCKMGKRILL